MPSVLTIRPYEAGDETAILATFNRVFREVCGPEFVERDLEFWRWSFAQCPAGYRIFLAVDECGTVAAQYACVPHRVATPFGQRVFLHTVDSMVHPEFRAGLKRPGLFVETARVFQRAACELGDSLTFGYPVRAAERIGKRYLDYETLGVVDYLVADPDARRTSPPLRVEQVDDLRGLRALVSSVAEDKACATIRDAAFLDWRYTAIPGDPYVRLVARRGGQVVGAAVVRPEHELIPGACTIAEWLVPTEDVDAREALLAAITELARRHRRRVVLAVFAPSSAEFAAFQRTGFTVEPSSNTLERRMTIVHFGAEFDNEWLRQHWWFTLGDSDLV